MMSMSLIMYGLIGIAAIGLIAIIVMLVAKK